MPQLAPQTTSSHNRESHLSFSPGSLRCSPIQFPKHSSQHSSWQWKETGGYFSPECRPRQSSSALAQSSWRLQPFFGSVVGEGHHQITRAVLSPSFFHSLLIGSAPGCFARSIAIAAGIRSSASIQNASLRFMCFPLGVARVPILTLYLPKPRYCLRCSPIYPFRSLLTILKLGSCESDRHSSRNVSRNPSR